MVGMSGREMWKKLEEIGPRTSANKIPEEVIINGDIIGNINTVTKVWVETFASLYKGVSDNSPGYDSEFLIQAQAHAQQNVGLVRYANSENLNSPITSAEVRLAVKEARNGKSVFVDKLPNEIFKNDSSIECLTNLYNLCFKESIIPSLWRKSLISPIYKGKNKDKRNPESYRPVSLICNPCKIFTNIINKRLLQYLECNNLLAEEQNGFCSHRSCEDYVFVLDSIIRLKLLDKKTVYGCFVDFSSAFDSLNRDLLMYVLQKYGIQNDFANIIKVLYKGTECAIKLNDKTTEWFPIYAGVRQGQNDSTTLFAMFVNSVADKINTP